MSANMLSLEWLILTLSGHILMFIPLYFTSLLVLKEPTFLWCYVNENHNFEDMLNHNENMYGIRNH